MTASNEEKLQVANELPQVSFPEFEPTTYEEWKEEAITALKGGVFEKQLFTSTYEGIKLEPIYTSEHTKDLKHPGTLPGFDCYLRGTHAEGYITRPWFISQQCDEVLPQNCNHAIKHELAKGATAINIALNEATKKGLDADKAPTSISECGLCLSTLDDINQALNGLSLDKFPLHIETGPSNLALLGMLSAFLSASGQKYSSLSGYIAADPIGILANEGTLPCSLDALYDEMAHALKWSNDNMPNMRTILVSGQVYHNGGANNIQELGYAFATAVEYIRAMQLRGLDINIIARHIQFSFSIGSNFFMELSKMRAARLVWAQIVEAFGGDKIAQQMNIHARTSYFTKTIYDPYVNMLRTTTEAFSGVVGGIDSLTVSAFDEVIRPSDEFSRRIARNTQLILQNECNLRQPIDPAGGSWYIETLTNSIAEKTWNLLQQIEEEGGIIKALEKEIPQNAISEILNQRFKKLATRADRSVGTNMYPNITEKRLEKTPINIDKIRSALNNNIATYRSDLDLKYCATKLSEITNKACNSSGEIVPALIDAFKGGATLGEVNTILRKDETAISIIRPIKCRRLTEMFEKMRMATEIYKEKTGRNLKIFLANMGKIPQHKARADFTTGFVEVAGFEVLKNNGFSTVEEAAEAAIQSGASVTVICSTDATYPELVPPLAKQIKKAKPEMIIFLAGAPAPEYEEIYKEAGVDNFIHVKANCYQILSDLQKARGII